MLKGRAATPVRPGFMIYNILAGKQPIGEKKEIVHEAGIVDLHRQYRALIENENHYRTKKTRLRPMTYHSFVKIVKFAQLLGLVKVVREVPMVHPPDNKRLYRVSKRPAGGLSVVISKIRVIQLTDLGQQETVAWRNLCRAWIEEWPIPTIGEPVPLYVLPEDRAQPIIEPKKRGRPPLPEELKKVKVPGTKKRGRPVTVVPTPPELDTTIYTETTSDVPILEEAAKPAAETPMEHVAKFESLAEFLEDTTPTKTNVQKLIDHLNNLTQIGLNDPEVHREIYKLSMSFGDWDMYYEDRLSDEEDKEKPNTARIKKYTEQKQLTSEVSDALNEYDANTAIKVLKKLLAK